MTLPARAINPAVKREMLRQVPLFRDLRPAEIEQVLGFSAEQRVPRGTLLFQRGDPGSSMMAVLRGRIRISAVSPEGKEVTLNVIEPGGIFGEIALLDGKPRTADATAVEDSVLLTIERRDFLPFLNRNEDLMLRLLAVLCDKLRSTSATLEEIATLPLPARLASVLVKLAGEYGTRTPEGELIRMKLSQRDISALVAATRESVNKQLRQWREEGLVSESGGYLLIRKLAALQRLTD
jgi:CRP-like cAMP-binding protein